MALVFPTPAQAALQTPVNTYSPTSTPLTNTANTSTYTYDPVRGVWLTAPGASANSMPCSGGTFTGPVQFDCPSLFCGIASFCCNTAFACTATFDDIVVCGTALHCGDTITCGDHYVYGTTYNIGNTVTCGTALFCGNVEVCGNTVNHGTALFCGAVTNESTVTNCALVENCGNTVTYGTALFCGNVTNEGTVTNCALVENCADVCNHGTTYNIGDTVTCGNSLFCGNVDVCGTTTNYGDIYNCGTTYNIGDTVTCGNALFCGNMETCGNVVNNGSVTNCGATTFCGTTTFENTTTFCNPVTFCTTPVLPPGTPLGCALDVTYDNATSGLTATNVQDALDELAGSSSAAIPCACLTAIGSLLSSDGATPTALPVGTDGQILVADSGEALGLKWISQAPAGVSSVTGTSPIAVDNTDPSNPIVGIDAASTAQAGAVQLYDNIDSTSTTEAATANAAKIAYDAALNSVQSVTGTVPVQIDNTDPQNPDISVDAATTAAPGIVQLNDTVTSTSTTEAGTANAVKTAYDLAAAAVPDSTFTALGELVVGTGAATYVVLSPGANGEVLSADSGAPSGLSWVAAATGTVTSITAGVGLNGGTITTSGTIDLADTAVVPGSYTYSSFTVDQQGRITAASNGATPVLPADFTAKGDILAADAAGSFVALGVGTDGQILIADSAEASGLKWISQTPAGVASVTGTSPIVVNNGDPANPVVGIDAASTTQPGAVQLNDTVTSTSATEAATANALKTAYDLAAAAVPDATFTAKGEVVVGTGASAYVALAPTTDGQILVADAAEASGLKWVAQAPGGVQSVTGLSPIVVDNTDAANPIISAPVIPDATFTVAGELIVGTGAASYVALTPGTNGQVLSADNTDPNGLVWVTPNAGTVTSITAGVGLNGGTITASGTIDLADTAVVPGSYTYSSFTVDQQGRITAASDGATPVLPADFTAKGDVLVGTAAGTYSALGVGTDGHGLVADSAQTEGVKWAALCQGTLTGVTVNAPLSVDNTNPAVPDLDINVATTVATGVVSVGTNIAVDAAGEISVADATTAAKGVVQLYDGLNSTSTTLALTAARGKDLQDQIDALSVAAGLVLAGTYDASTNQMVTVTANGAAEGFTVGSDYPAAAAGNTDFFVIVTVAGGGATVGDWYLSDGTAWNLVDVGYQAPSASTTQQGIVELATEAETQAGTDATRAVTPSSLQSKLSDSTSTTSSSTIASSTAVKAAYDLAAAAIPCADFTAKGEVLVGTAAGTYTALTVGTNGQILVADSGETSGLKWAAACQGTVTNIATGTGLTGGPITATGTIALADTAVSPGTYSFACISVDQQGRLTAASSGPTPVLPANFDAKGDLLVGTADNAYSALPVGADGYVLTALSGVTEGVAWCPVCSPVAQPTVFGAVYGCTPNSASGNALVGFCSGASLPSASQSAAVGTCALRVASSGQNIGIGFRAGVTISTGCCNTIIGTCSGAQITTGCNNIVIGNQATPAANGDSQLVIGNSIGGTQCHWIQGDGSYNVVIPQILKPVGGICDCANVIGTAGQVLASTGSGVEWVTNAAADAIPCAAFDAKGDLLVGTGSDTFVALPVGGDGLVLTTNSACTEGVEWVAASSGGPAEPLVQGSVYGCVTSFSAKNAGIGYNALQASGFGPAPCNAALGYEAAYSLDTGGDNVAIGAYALRSGDSASCNTAVGLCSLYAITSGECNVSIGHLAGCNLTTGNRNTLLGQRAGFNVSTGCLNVVIGPGTQVPDGDANCQLAIGPGGANYWLSGGADLNIQPGAGILDCTGSAGTAGQVLSSDGANALEWITPSGGVQSVTGTSPITVGGTAANPVVAINAGTTGQPGAVQLCDAVTSTDTSKAATPNAVKTAYDLADAAIPCSTITAKGDLVVGTGASTPVALPVGTNGLVLAANSACASGLEWINAPAPPGACPTIAGALYGRFGNAADKNASVGYGSLNITIAGNARCNAALGWEAAFALNSGNCNVAVGMCSLRCTTSGCGNTAVGALALCGGTVGVGNTAVGILAGKSVTFGSINTFVGTQAATVATGGANVAVGANAALAMTNASCNIAIGMLAACNLTTGNRNVVLGPITCVPAPAGDCQLVLGFGPTDYWLTGCSDKNIQPGAGILDCANSAGTLGQSLWTTGANAIVWSAASPSDARDKVIHGAIETALPVINQLEPVSYSWAPRETGEQQNEIIYGFVAQQLQEVDPTLVDASDEEYLRVHDRKIVPLLVKAIQELSAQVTELKAEVETLKNQ